jgi:hypothetical protein
LLPLVERAQSSALDPRIKQDLRLQSSMRSQTES